MNSKTLLFYPIWQSLLFSGAVFLLGCGKTPDGQIEVHPVKGRVTVDGKAAQGVVVALYPAEGSSAAAQKLIPSGITDENGDFLLTTYSQDDGAPDGTYRATLQWLDQPKQTAKGPPAGFLPPVDKFRGRYINPAKSAWTITIAPETADLPVFEIPKL